jgi:hypothetical protein
LFSNRHNRSTCRGYDSSKLISGKNRKIEKPRSILDFSHPNLEYVYAETVYSPYMIKPKDKYPKEIYEIANKVRDLKNKGLKFREIPAEERPYDPDAMKAAFVNEVILYNPSYLAKPKVFMWTLDINYHLSVNFLCLS